MSGLAHTSVYNLFIYPMGVGLSLMSRRVFAEPMVGVQLIVSHALFFKPRTTGKWCDKHNKDMYDDLKENIILVMQHPIARRPISNLSDEEREKAFDLLNYLSTLSVEYKTTNDTEKVIRHFRTALQHLEKGGFDLSISKWTELVSLRTKEDTE